MSNKNFDYNWTGDKNADAPHQYLKMVVWIILMMVCALILNFCS
jgi:hypothetical protein